MKLKMTSPWSQASGTYKTTNLVYYMLEGQCVARARPTNKTKMKRPSGEQTKVQVYMTAISREWQTLSDAQRAAWMEYAKRYLSRDEYNRPIAVSAIASYVRANSVRSILGLPSNPEAPVGRPPLRLRAIGQVVGLPADSLGVVIEHDHRNIDGYQVIVRATGPLKSRSRRPAPSDYRYVCGLNSASAQPLPPSGQALVFSSILRPIAQGAKYAVEARIVRLQDGILSRPAYGVFARE